MNLLTLLGLSLLVALVDSAVPPVSSQLRVKEAIVALPRGWTPYAPAPPDYVLDLRIALHQPHWPVLEKHLLEISHPDHPRYGDHLSREETQALMMPHSDSLDAVNSWLASYGIHEEHLIRSSAQDWITIRVPVDVAEKMLGTKFAVYQNAETGEHVVRTTAYSLPVFLHQYIDLIQPTTMFARFRALSSTLHWHSTDTLAGDGEPGTIMGPAGNPVDASCNKTITPSCLRQLYNAVDYETSSSNGNEIGITGYLGQYINNKDLQTFYKTYVPSALGSNYTFISVNNGLNNQTTAAAGVEANLDAQYAFGLTYPTPGTFYSTVGTPPIDPDRFITTKFNLTNTNEPYSEWLDYVLSAETVPQTISTSYGDDEQTVPKSYAIRVCKGFAALGARGVSLLFGSGDFGVGDGNPDPANQTCISNDGRNATVFLPTFPAGCPYVTSVGGTQGILEKAASFSGGGFSNYFSRPSYQDKAVADYMETLAPGMYDGLYNSSGRGFPDVSAQSVGFRVAYKDNFTLVDGTSASCPAFASIISMVNDARLSAGKKCLGFLNPWLYSKAYTALNDITEGNNPGCGTQGFEAAIGWDPVTGLGTPDFQKLKELD